MKKKTRSNIIMIAVIDVIVCAGVFGVGKIKGWFDKPEEPTALLTGYKGIVTIERDGVAYSLQEDTFLRKGDRISCDPGSRATIVTGEGSITLGDNAVLEVTDPTVSGFSASIRAGEVYADAVSRVKLSFEDQEIALENAAAEFSIRSGAQSVSVYSGKAEGIEAGTVKEWVNGVASERQIALNSLSAFTIAELRKTNSRTETCFSDAQLDQLIAEREAEAASQIDIADVDIIDKDDISDGSGNQTQPDKGGKKDDKQSDKGGKKDDKQPDDSGKKEDKQPDDGGSGDTTPPDDGGKDDATPPDDGGKDDTTPPDDGDGGDTTPPDDGGSGDDTTPPDDGKGSDDTTPPDDGGSGDDTTPPDDGGSGDTAPPDDGGEEPPEDKKTYCTISIRCDTILDNWDDLEPEKQPYVPDNGWILGKTKVEFAEGETVFDVLKRVCERRGIQLEYSWSPMYDSYYVEGIHHLYEFDCGIESGWMYKVNGWFPNYGCSSYTLSENDDIVWCYSCKGLGADVGGGM